MIKKCVGSVEVLAREHMEVTCDNPYQRACSGRFTPKSLNVAALDRHLARLEACAVCNRINFLNHIPLASEVTSLLLRYTCVAFKCALSPYEVPRRWYNVTVIQRVGVRMQQFKTIEYICVQTFPLLQWYQTHECCTDCATHHIYRTSVQTGATCATSAYATLVTLCTMCYLGYIVQEPLAGSAHSLFIFLRIVHKGLDRPLPTSRGLRPTSLPTQK